MVSEEDLRLAANTIRGLAMDAIEKANSGHPGMPLGCADIAAVLWAKIMKYNPEDPEWADRDRFILSTGHGSMLLYSMLCLTGCGLSVDDLKNFRQWGSLTPGHPEFRHTKGVETTTGPLGQGFANGIGMALAEKLLAGEFNDGVDIISHYIYAIVGDGDLMEGVSYEAASLAGHWKLGNIIYIYDSNSISIEGSTDVAFTEDPVQRFEACGWHVQTIDGHDFQAIEKAVLAAQAEKDRPSLIIAKTKIAKGSPNKEGSASSHGSPLGADEIRLAKKNLGLPETDFYVPDAVINLFRNRTSQLKEEYSRWKSLFSQHITGSRLELWKKYFEPSYDVLKDVLPDFAGTEKISTRSAGGKVLEALFPALPGLTGGSADLAPSTKTFVKGFSETGKGFIGRNIHFGVREMAMGAIQNGIAYYGGFVPYSSTFFVFMDYVRPAVRVAAISGLKSVFVFTHDSFFVGEDGPTHEPVEHLAAARAIPGLNVFRPADGPETSAAWLEALKGSGPSVICLSRQDLPVIRRDNADGAYALSRGAYIICDCKDPDIVILATGSEVSSSIAAAEILAEENISARVVSFPSWNLFDQQSDEYRTSVLPSGAKYAVVEAGRSMGWEKYAGPGALFVTLEHFGASAPAGVLAEKFGFTSEKIAASIKAYLS